MERVVKLFIVAILIIAALALVFNNGSITGNVVKSGNGGGNSGPSKPPIDINYSNIEEQLSRNSVVRNLPDNANLLLRFYNFDSGEREWEKSFVVKKGELKEGYSEDVDLILYLHSNYLDELNNRNFCNVVSKANKNGDLGFDLGISKIGFAWKYKSMNKYKDCFGF